MSTQIAIAKHGTSVRITQLPTWSCSQCSHREYAAATTVNTMLQAISHGLLSTAVLLRIGAA